MPNTQVILANKKDSAWMPPTRYYARCKDELGNGYFIVGGYSFSPMKTGFGVWYFRPDKMQWHFLKKSKVIQDGKYGGFAWHCSKRDELYYFGGQSRKNFRNENRVSKLSLKEFRSMKLSLKQMEEDWEEVVAERSTEPRCHMAGCWDQGNQKFISFGGLKGFDRGAAVYNSSMSMFSTQDSKWSNHELTRKNAFIGANCHWLKENVLITFGGNGWECSKKLYNNVRLYSFDTHEFTVLHDGQKKNNQDEPPEPRAFYASCLMNEGRYLFVGFGMGYRHQLFEDVYRFDTRNLIWKKIELHIGGGASLVRNLPRSSCSFFPVEQLNRIVVFGGETYTALLNDCIEIRLSSHEDLFHEACLKRCKEKTYTDVCVICKMDY